MRSGLPRAPGVDGSTVLWRPADWLASSPSGSIVRGAPKLVAGPGGWSAVWFDGVTDALLMDHHPMEGWDRFAVEAELRVEPGARPEQRLLHLQQNATDDRLLLETRGVAEKDAWYADTIVVSQGQPAILADPRRLHAAGQWQTLAIVCDGSHMHQVVDGTVERSCPLRVAPLGAGSLCLGMRLNHITPFRGAIATVRFTRLDEHQAQAWQAMVGAFPMLTAPLPSAP